MKLSENKKEKILNIIEQIYEERLNVKRDTWRAVYLVLDGKKPSGNVLEHDRRKIVSIHLSRQDAEDYINLQSYNISNPSIYESCVAREHAEYSNLGQLLAILDDREQTKIK